MSNTSSALSKHTKGIPRRYTLKTLGGNQELSLIEYYEGTPQTCIKHLII